MCDAINEVILLHLILPLHRFFKQTVTLEKAIESTFKAGADQIW